MDLKEAEIMGGDPSHHWYYRSKYMALERFVDTGGIDKVLDVGSGSGFFAEKLLRHTQVNEAWCVDTSYASDSDRIVDGKALHMRRSVGSLDVDLVMLMDVLEHVDDDVGLLRSYAEKVPHGAQFLVSVPAFQFLWSEHDEFLDHRRRYRLTQIEQVCVNAGLKVVRGSYYFGSVFPAAALLRLSERIGPYRKGEPQSQLQEHSKWVNALLSRVCKAELPFLRYNRLFGLTAFCLAVR